MRLVLEIALRSGLAICCGFTDSDCPANGLVRIESLAPFCAHAKAGDKAIREDNYMTMMDATLAIQKSIPRIWLHACIR